MLEYEIWGNTVQTWVVSILIVIGAFVVVKLLSLLGRKVIKPFIARTNNRVDDIIYYSLEAPLKFAVMLLGIWIAIHRLVYPDQLVKYVDNAYRILIILDITWVLARLYTTLLQQYWGPWSTWACAARGYWVTTGASRAIRTTRSRTPPSSTSPRSRCGGPW